jgi:hypothetical protein
MANNNNCLYNAAYMGFIEGALAGRKISSATAGSYLKLTQAAQAFAKQVDSNIAEDGLITTGGGSPAMLVDTGSNTVQSDTQMRPQLLRSVCAGVMTGSYTEDSTQADYTSLAAACAASYTEALLLLVSP